MASAPPAQQSLAGLERPDRDLRVGAALVGFFVIVMILAAAFVRLDAAAHGTGQVVVSDQRKEVQHREGGVVSEVLVQEGQRVAQGQVLLRLAGADVLSQERALSAQVVRLLARRARLEAEVASSRTMRPPAEYASVSDQDRSTAASSLAQESAELSARWARLDAERGALTERIASSGYQGQGQRQQSTSADEQIRLIDEELAGLRPLAERGFVSQTRIRALERARAELQGRQGETSSGSSQAARQASEARMQLTSLERAFRERATSELSTTLGELGELQPRLQAARDQLQRTEIRAPVSGTVIGLTATTVGGVITPGQKLMDIVPDDAQLRVSAQIAPDDADDVRVGQNVQVRFIGLHERGLPTLQGVVTRLSADAFKDERTGSSYFVAEVEVPDDQLAIIQQARGSDFELRPGMPAEILIRLRARSALSYLMEPLIGAFWGSLNEH